MTKEELIEKILGFSANLYEGFYLKDSQKDKEWDRDKLLSLPNLTLHLIWRELRNGTGIS